MTDDQVNAAVERIISEQLLYQLSDRIKKKFEHGLFPHTLLREELYADSLDVVEILIHINEKFGVLIEDTECENWVTVGDVQRTVREAMNRE